MRASRTSYGRRRVRCLWLATPRRCCRCAAAASDSIQSLTRPECELAKMDGAIVLSSDLKRIVYANTQLIPDPSIPTSETGTRHRTAQRMAKQTGNLVIAISQKRNIVTLYKDNLKYVMHDIGVVLAKANQALQTLENYKGVLNRVLSNLSVLEFEDAVSLFEVVVVIQRMEMVRRVAEEISDTSANSGMRAPRENAARGAHG